MEVEKIEEQPDGSAIATLYLSAEEVSSLIQSAVIIGLTEGLKLVEKERIKECQELAQSTSNT